MTPQEAAIVSAVTGVLIGNCFDELHALAEELLERPIMSAEFNGHLFQELQPKALVRLRTLEVDRD